MGGKKKSSDYACKRLGSGRRGCSPTLNTKVMIQICDSSKAWTKWTRESSTIGWNSDKYYFRFCKSDDFTLIVEKRKDPQE